MNCSDCVYCRKVHRQLLDNGQHRDIEIQCAYGTAAKFVSLMQNVPVNGDYCPSPSWCPAKCKNINIGHVINRSRILPSKSRIFV